ncbi:PilZ domain-containing protein [Afifella sp. IM 167]|uniref:PilZ domain-containing protein n=1 Tax=Afifella sp. IM 167 TaxID=2033586 RepID=UPI001CCCEF37|nr:PilZ domain-containing protein [Afifella sp. IM 167]MBZ8135041.1 hypothetical protein [Afifella sp. IM 167]
MEERRLAERYPAAVQAAIVSPNLFARILIRDISTSGARIEFLRSVALPETFRLRIPNCETLPAHVVWQEGTLAGICFSRTIRETTVLSLAQGPHAAALHHSPGWA